MEEFQKQAAQIFDALSIEHNVTMHFLMEQQRRMIKALEEQASAVSKANGV